MMLPHRHTKFKEGCEKKLVAEYQQLKPQSQLIAEDMSDFCERNGEEFVMTDIMSDATEDKLLNRVSDSHSEGRAFDFRTHNWSKEFLDKFEKYFETKYARFAALSKKSGERNLIVYHDNGHGMHGHCQIRKGL
jgi:hypothetical protein